MQVIPYPNGGFEANKIILLVSMIMAISFVEKSTGSVLRPSTPVAAAIPSPQQEQPQTESTGSCSTDQVIEMPCRCCKMDCWYTVAKSATHELGHVPGQAGEAEAMATLKLIRACMIQECSEVCTMAPRPRLPFSLPMTSD